MPDDFLSSRSVDQREMQWREILQRRAADVWVADDRRGIAGWICVGRSRDADAERSTSELWAIYVDPPYWRTGAGRALWTVAETHLTSAGFSEITVWVLRENARALGFYESLGFTIERGRQKTIELGGVVLAEIRLRRRLVDR